MSECQKWTCPAMSVIPQVESDCAAVFSVVGNVDLKEVK